MSYSILVKVVSSEKARGWFELMNSVLGTSPCEYQLLGGGLPLVKGLLGFSDILIGREDREVGILPQGGLKPSCN